jgi:hypothetical protein
MDSASIEQLVQKEPWRTGQVWTTDALDPAWAGEQPLCKGEIQWSDNGKWWWCTSCGYCGFWSNTSHHTVKHPYETLLLYGALFIRKRAAQGMSAAQAILQLTHAFSAVAKLMINTAPEDAVRIVERLREDV